jgi:hypothetical protein
MPSIFDILNDISFDKHEILSEKENFKDYNPFMINRFLSMDGSTLFLSNFINRMSHLPKEVQYQFYLKGIDKKKRFFKYQKKEGGDKKVKIIKKYYNCNDEKAMELLEILKDDQIKSIEKSLNMGGKK